MNTIKVSDAVWSLRPNCKYAVRGDVLEWMDDDVSPPTDAEIQAEIVRLQSAYDNNKYSRDRATEYPHIADQLDMLWHAMDTGEIPKSTIFYDINKSIKEKYPKE
jgi:hypothetical protein